MHRPGYVQGGQEAKCGYLLLGIYYRRIPGDILPMFLARQRKDVQGAGGGGGGRMGGGGEVTAI